MWAREAGRSLDAKPENMGPLMERLVQVALNAIEP